MQYTVVISSEPDGSWRAVAPLLPDCVVAAPSRAEALAQIKEKLAAATARWEVVQVEVPSSLSHNGQPPPASGEQRWPGFGAFKDDPWRDQLFDEIERQRDATVVRE